MPPICAATRSEMLCLACYERCAHVFMPAICIAVTVIFWINQ